MNIQFIKDIANRDKALARAVEISIYAVLGYVLGAIVEGEILSMQAAISALCTPLLAFVGKKSRDIKKTNE